MRHCEDLLLPFWLRGWKKFLFEGIPGYASVQVYWRAIGTRCHIAKSTVVPKLQVLFRLSCIRSHLPNMTENKGSSICKHLRRLKLYKWRCLLGCNISGTLFGLFKWNISRTHETCEWVVLFFFRWKCSKQNFTFHFFKAIYDYHTSFRPSRTFFGKRDFKTITLV